MDPHVYPRVGGRISRFNLFHFKAWSTCSVDNQLASPLVRTLPPEIRSLIWKQVIGGRVFHPTNDAITGFEYHACVNERSSRELYDLSRAPDDALFSMEGYSDDTSSVHWVKRTTEEKHAMLKSVRSAAFGHHDCLRNRFSVLAKIAFIRRGEPGFLKHLAVLRSCKLFHDEVTHAFWTTNTFAFSNTNEWRFFVHSLSASERDLIHSVDLSFHTGQLMAPYPTFFQFNLKGLRKLHLHLQDSRDGFLHRRSLNRVTRAIRSLLGEVELTTARVTLIADNVDHSHCQCHSSHGIFSSSMPALNQQECWDIADTLTEKLRSNDHLVIEDAAEHGPRLSRPSREAGVPHVSKQMYVCNTASTAGECREAYQAMLKKRIGGVTNISVESCSAQHRCVFCRRREGITLLHGASVHCEHSGECDELGGYNNPHIMPVERFD